MTTSDEIHKKIDNILEPSTSDNTAWDKLIQSNVLVAEVLNEINWNLTFIRKELEGIKRNV